MVCGNRAGALTVLLDHNGMNGFALNAARLLVGEQSPAVIVSSLSELQAFLRDKCDLRPPPKPHAAVEAVMRP